MACIGHSHHQNLHVKHIAKGHVEQMPRTADVELAGKHQKFDGRLQIQRPSGHDFFLWFFGVRSVSVPNVFCQCQGKLVI